MLANRVKESSLTSGTGTITLNGAVASYRTFSSVFSNTSKTYYTITNSDQWEVGLGTYNLGTLSRDTVLSSSNSGDKIVLSGQSFVFVAYPAEKSVYKDNNDKVIVGSSGILIASGTPSSTTNALYNVGDSLYFNGAAIGGGNTYTAGTGLVLSGFQFNVDNSVIQSGDNISLLNNNAGYGVGTVTSANVSGGTTGLTTTGGPITTAGTITLAGTLAVANGGTAGTTAAAARTNLSAAVLGTNTDITGLTGLTGTVQSPVSFNWNTTGGQAGGVLGRMKWNATDMTMDIGVSDGSVTLQVGQENHTPARNNTGSLISDFQVVRLTGSQANRVTIALAQANNAANVYNVYGITTQDIANNATGFVTTYGLINGVNTSAFTAGDILYLSDSVAGGFTNVPPVAPSYRIPVATVVTAHSSTGRILVNLHHSTSIGDLTGDILVSGASSGDCIGFNGSLWVPASSASIRTRPYSTKSSSYTMTSSDEIIFTDSTSGPITVTLPTAVDKGGRELLIKRSAGNNTVTIAASGSQTIDGSSSFTMTQQNQSISLVSNNVNWFIT